jgi:hypothetical protein
MDEFLANLCEKLKYVSHEYEADDSVKIFCRMDGGIAVCPYCGQSSDKVNKRYKRVLKDSPFGDKKVTLIVKFNSYFCKNDECSHFSFAETVGFAEPFATRTKRLEKQILEAAIGSSGIGAERYLRRNVATVSDTTINRIIKKNSFAKLNGKTHSD